MSKQWLCFAEAGLLMTGPTVVAGLSVSNKQVNKCQRLSDNHSRVA